MISLEARLAWRNVWRSPRRTALTVAATAFAVFLVVVFGAMAAGMYEKLIEDSVRIHAGHVSLSARGYLDEQTLDRYVELSPELLAALDGSRGVVGWTPRLASFALLSKSETSRGAVIVGVDPAQEGRVSTLPERLRKGRFLAPGGEREVVVGARLADALGADVGDELLMYGTAYTLETSYELFTVVGLLALPEAEFERSLALVSLRDAQSFFVYGNRVSEVAVLAASADASSEVRDALVSAVARISAPGNGIEVHTWAERMPELEQIISIDRAGMYMMLAILVVVAGFGILNTLLMSVLQRTRELGVVLALGLRPRAVFRVVYLESLFVAGVGIAVGIAFAIPLVLYMQANPIAISTAELGGVAELFGMEPVVRFKLEPLNPLGSTLTVLLVAAVAALYPALKASAAEPAQVLRSL